jgi:hypothetical protein
MERKDDLVMFLYSVFANSREDLAVYMWCGAAGLPKNVYCHEWKEINSCISSLYLLVLQFPCMGSVHVLPVYGQEIILSNFVARRIFLFAANSRVCWVWKNVVMATSFVIRLLPVMEGTS